MAYINNVILVGNLGQEPTLKYTKTNQPYCKFSVATRDSYLDKNKNHKVNTTWHQVIIWSKSAEYIAKTFKTGQIVYVEGKITNSSWTDKDNVKHTSSVVTAFKVQLLGRISSNDVPCLTDEEAESLACEVLGQEDLI